MAEFNSIEPLKRRGRRKRIGDEIYLNDVAVATGYNVLLALGHAHQAVLGDDTR